jgi:type I restriction enzyme S subunit
MNARPGYKQTEIGDIPEEWQVVRLNQVCRVRRGASPRPIDDPSFFSAEGRGWIRIVDVTSTYKYLRKTTQYLSQKGVSRSVQVDPGDLIMSICATIGKPVILDMEACIHDGFVVFSELHTDTDSEYLFYVLQSKESEFVGKKQTGTQGNLNTTIVGKTAFALPSLSEQQRIVSILATCDDEIQKTDEIIAKSQQLKKGLMQQLLTKGIGHTKFKQTEIGEIAEEWELDRLGNCLLSDPQNGIYKDQSFYGRGTSIVRIDDFYDGSFTSLSGFQRLELSDSEIATYMLRPRDILVNRVNSLPFLGKAVIVPELAEPTAFESNMMKITTRPDRLLPEYTIAWLCAEHAKAHFLSRAKRAVAQASINQGDLCSLLVPVPTIAEQTEIIRVLQSAQEKLAREAEEKEQLTRLKKGLMQVLLTGKVRVKVN